VLFRSITVPIPYPLFPILYPLTFAGGLILNDRSLSVLILAGGRSTRMGRDKATIEIGGVPLIRRIYDVVAGCQDLEGDKLATSQRIYVVTPWIDRYQSILPAACDFIPEQPPDRGPIIAFARGLEKISSTWVLLIACDLPNLSTPVVQAWIDRLPAISAQSMAYLPRNPHKGWEPLCGFYRQICRHSLREYINAGGQSFQGWLEMNVVTELAIADRVWLANCNTPADLAQIGEDWR
jgi:molybdenum cofactor guanylyltransferase